MPRKSRSGEPRKSTAGTARKSKTGVSRRSKTGVSRKSKTVDARKSSTGDRRKSASAGARKPATVGRRKPARKSAAGDRLTIERLGGFAGFGLPGSRIRSAGEMSMATLSGADSAALDALFKRPTSRAPRVPDSFVYRLTRTLGDRADTVDVPEEHVPLAIRNCVKDTLR